MVRAARLDADRLLVWFDWPGRGGNEVCVCVCVCAVCV